MHSERKTYKCLSVKMFDTWRILFYGFIFISILLGIIWGSWKDAFIFGSVISLLLALTHIGCSYTEVERHGDNLKVRNLWKILYLNNLEGISTWWSYDYGISSIELGEGTQGKTQALSNKINCFIKLKGGNEVIYLYEQIHLSDKFPNHHQYASNEKINEALMIRIWDVDKCIDKLNLNDK